MKKILYIFLFFITTNSLAQHKDAIQFAGYVRDAATGTEIPFCALYIEKTSKGSITNLDGYFNFVVAENDTVTIKSLGYKAFKVVIPNDIDGTNFSKEIALEMDPVMLKEVVIRPLPSPHQLRQSMVNLNLPDNMTDLARATIERSLMDENLNRNMAFDGNESFNQYVKSQVNYYYTYGNQRPSISLLSPIAWTNFIKALKNGDFKKKKK